MLQLVCLWSMAFLWLWKQYHDHQAKIYALEMSIKMYIVLKMPIVRLQSCDDGSVHELDALGATRLSGFLKTLIEGNT